MRYAELNVTGKWISCDAQALDASYQRYIYRCPECKAQAFLCISHRDMENYFRSNFHQAGCGIASGGIVIKEPSGREFRLEDVFKHVDKPYVAAPAKQKIDGFENDFDIDDDITESVDNITIHEIKKLRQCSSMYNAIEKMKTDDHILPNLLVQDFVIDARTIENARKTTLRGRKMIVATRFNIKTLNPPLERPADYVCLRDAYTKDERKAIYYFLSFAEPTRDKHFRDLIFGNKRENFEKDPHKYIVAMGNLTPIYDPNYTIYVVEPLSSARFCMTNRKDPFNE